MHMHIYECCIILASYFPLQNTFFSKDIVSTSLVAEHDNEKKTEPLYTHENIGMSDNLYT